MQSDTATRDVAAPWFRARRKLGIDDTIYFGAFEASSGRRHVLTLPHEKADGTGVLRHFLRHHGVREWQESEFPARTVPGFWQCWRQHRRQPSVQLPQWQPGKPLADSTTPLIALAAFTVEQTDQINSRISAAGVSTNAWLLHQAQQCLQNSVLTSAGGSWFIPVTLRGAITMAEDEMNHASGFYFSVPHGADAEWLHTGLRAALKRAEHWWLWHQARLVSGAGQWCVDLLFRYFLKQSTHIGSFSTLGEWQVDWRDTSLPDDALLWGCPPTSPTHPAAFLWLLCNGRLVLSLKLNSVLGIDQSGCEALMRRWQAHIRAAAGINHVFAEVRYG